MINILHTIDTFGPGGAETVFINLVRGLNTHRYNSVVAISGKGWVHEELRSLNFKPLVIDSKGSFSARYLWQLVQIVKRYDIDIIQSHLFGSNVYCSLAGIICHVPVISIFHGAVDANDKDKMVKCKIKIVNYGSKRIVLVSESLHEFFVERMGVSRKRAITIYNGIDFERFKTTGNDSLRNELGLAQDDVLIGSVGNIRSAKSYDILLHSAARIIKRYPRCKFVVVGQGSGRLYNDLLNLRDRLSLKKEVFFLGFRSNISEILNNLDIFLLTSTSEGFSISTVEAMACGVPVVATKCGGPEEIIVNNENGILAQVGDERDLAKGVTRLIENGRFRKKIVASARQTVSSKFKLSSMIARYDRIYSTVLRKYAEK